MFDGKSEAYISTTNSIHNANIAYAGSQNYMKRADVGKYPVFAAPYRDIFSWENTKVLEFGCGNGLFWESAAPFLLNSAELTLTDNSEEMLKEAKERLTKVFENYPIKKLSFQQMDINQYMPFSNESFDCVIGHNVIYHANNPFFAVSDCYRVLKPHGILGLSSMADDIESELYSIGQKIDETVPSKTFSAHCSVSKLKTHLHGFFDKKNIVETPYLGGRTFQTADAVAEMFCSQPDIQKLKLASTFFNEFSESIEKVMQDGEYRVDLGMTLFTCRK